MIKRSVRGESKIINSKGKKFMELIEIGEIGECTILNGTTRDEKNEFTYIELEGNSTYIYKN